MPALTSKLKERFCQEFIIDCNGTKAATRAGYKETTANEQASRLMTDPKIRNRIAELQEEQQAQLVIDRDTVAKRLAIEAFATIEGIVQIVKGSVIVTDTANLTPAQLATIQTIRQAKDGSVSVVMRNNLPALLELAKITGLSGDINMAIATLAKYGIEMRQKPDGEWFVLKAGE